MAVITPAGYRLPGIIPQESPVKRKDGKYASLVTHGHKSAGGGSPTYNIWRAMKQRCINPNQPHYPRYGGRGIKVCKRWQKFENFLEDMGERPEGLSLDRIDNDGNYEPKNCQWSTLKTQGKNKRNNVWLTYKGKKMIMAEWARELGTGSGVLAKRHRKGWPVKEILFGKETAHV